MILSVCITLSLSIYGTIQSTHIGTYHIESNILLNITIEELN